MANRNPKGWTSSANLALTSQSFRFPQDTVDELTAIAAATGKSKRQIVKEAIHEYTARRSVRVGRQLQTPDR